MRANTALATFRLLLLLLVSTSACLPCGAQMTPRSTELELRIADIHPAPNYRHSSIDQAKKRLADGLEARYPIWTRPGGVTWARSTPVAVSIEWSEKKPIAGTLGVHVARGDYASVSGPRRIDIYARDSAGRFQLNASRWVEDEELLDRNLTWLNVEFRNASGGLVLVLHTGGLVLSIDEIRIRKIAVAGKARKVDRRASSAPLESLRAVRSDAARELRSSLQSRSACSSAGRAKGWAATPLKPYADLDPCKIQEKNRLRGISGFRFETESFVLRIDNGRDRERQLRVALAGVLESERKLGRLRAVTSNDGKIVLDAIEPLTETPVVLAPGETVHLWVDLVLSGLSPNATALELQLSELSEGTRRSVSIPALVADAPVKQRDWLAAVAWITLSEPIWNNPEAALAELRAGGNNVFMIPPWRVPVVVDYADTVSGRREYRRELAEFARTGIVLVELYALKKLGGCRGSNAAAMRTRIKRLVGLAKQAGVPYSRWAVYPTDEAHDDKLSELLACAKAIKSADSRVQIYANPTVSKNPRKALGVLGELAPYIDFWQPRLAILKGETLSFFQRQPRFWIYDNPQKPAKSESPLFYRALPWIAFDLGATGVGFWGYDDTAKTSAWDDFDGDRPDWAVMYETPAGPIPSRRWRAFRDGLEDIAAVRSTRGRLQKVLEQPACRVTPRFDPSACRHELVERLREGAGD